MQRYRTIAPYLLPLVCMAALLCVAAQNKESGSDPYTPTKLEWLAASTNAEERIPWDDKFGYSLRAAVQHPNTIQLNVHLSKRGDRQEAMVQLQHARAFLEEAAKTYGWDDWLVIRESIKVLD